MEAGEDFKEGEDIYLHSDGLCYTYPEEKHAHTCKCENCG